MIILRKSSDRGHNQENWLSSYHTFSFHTYYDPAHMGFRDLRVINEDRVAPERGFGMHPHENMEIISLVLEGALEHRDNMGNREVIGPYELQRITAGTGMRHSEVNPLSDQEVHFLQIWILPERQGIEPSYEIKKFPERSANALTLLASPTGDNNSARLRQDVQIYFGQLEADQLLDYDIRPGGHAWLQIIRGALDCQDQTLVGGDGAAISEENSLALKGKKTAEFLLFDLN